MINLVKKGISKKVFAIMVIILIMMALIPFAQAAAPNTEKIKNKIIAEAPKFEKLFPEVLTPSSDTSKDNDFVQIADALPLSPVKLTEQERRTLACFPGYYTPNQISARDGISDGSVQMLLEDTNYPIPTIIIVDDEMLSHYVAANPWTATWLGLCIWADNVLEGGDDYLESPYDIDFQTDWNYICYWESPDYMDYYGLLNEIDNVDPTGVGCDVMVLESGQNGGSGGGGTITGLANMNGRHFVMNACLEEWGIPSANIFQHEASHLFDCSDHGWDQTYCIMSYTYMTSYRGYCTGCDTQLYLNAGRFN